MHQFQARIGNRVWADDVLPHRVWRGGSPGERGHAVRGDVDDCSHVLGVWEAARAQRAGSDAAVQRVCPLWVSWLAPVVSVRGDVANGIQHRG